MGAAEAIAHTFDRVVDRALGPLDAARSGVLRRVGRPLAPLFADRVARVGLLGALGLVVGAGLVAAFPLFFLRVGPVLFGVAHLLADGRYLVAGAGLHRRPPVLGLVLLPCVLAWFLPTAAIGGVALLGAALAGRGAAPRRLAVAVLGLFGLGLSTHLGHTVDVLFAHLHNLVAFVAIFVLWSGRAAARRTSILHLALALGLASLLPVALEPRIEPGVHAALADFGAGLAPTPNGTSPFDRYSHAALVRFALVFGFLQTAHYLAWLRLVPELARPRTAPRGYASSHRALVRELGRPLVGLTGMLGLGFVVAACVDLETSRLAYFRLALFHGPLELGVLGLAAIESGAAWRR